MPHFADSAMNIPSKLLKSDGTTETGVVNAVPCSTTTTTIADITGYTSTPHAGFYEILCDLDTTTAAASATLQVEITHTVAASVKTRLLQFSNLSTATASVTPAVAVVATDHHTARHTIYCDTGTAIRWRSIAANSPIASIRLRVLDLNIA